MRNHKERRKKLFKKSIKIYEIYGYSYIKHYDGLLDDTSYNIVVEYPSTEDPKFEEALAYFREEHADAFVVRVPDIKSYIKSMLVDAENYQEEQEFIMTDENSYRPGDFFTPKDELMDDITQMDHYFNMQLSVHLEHKDTYVSDEEEALKEFADKAYKHSLMLVELRRQYIHKLERYYSGDESAEDK